MGVENHLLRFARIGACTSIMRLWQRRRRDATFTVVVTPSPSRRSRGSKRTDRPRPAQTTAAHTKPLAVSLSVLLAPSPGVAANRVIAALIAERTQLLEDPNERSPRSRAGLPSFSKSNRFKPLAPRPDFRLGLDIALIMELCRLRPDDLPNHFSRNTQIAADRLDRHLSAKNMPNEFWRSSPRSQHLGLGSLRDQGGLCGPLSPRSRLDADHPRKRGPYSMPSHT